MYLEYLEYTGTTTMYLYLGRYLVPVVPGVHGNFNHVSVSREVPVVPGLPGVHGNLNHVYVFREVP